MKMALRTQQILTTIVPTALLCIFSLLQLAPAALAFVPDASSIIARGCPHTCTAVSRSPALSASSSPSTSTTTAPSLQTLADEINDRIDQLKPEFIKNCKVRVAPSPSSGHRLGLVATDKIGKDSVALSIPYDDQLVLTPDLASKNVLEGFLPEGYDGWTGDVGLLAMLLLNELARADERGGDGGGGGGIALPRRKPECQALISSWIKVLPSPKEMSALHPLLWNEDVQEVLQGSSTRKIYRTLDDIEEDGTWLTERVWSADRTRFPETVTINGESRPCFTVDGFAWATAVASSRSNFVDGSLRILPFIDLANHADLGTEEVRGGTMGAFGTTKGAEIRTASTKTYEVGDEVFVNYGPKSAAEYLLEHGFIPKQARTTAVSELTFEVDQEDRFYDDKLDILEFETYDSAPMEPLQSFDVVQEPGRDGEPDPAIMQFLRLAKLGGKDAFLLESIFRKEVWGFMGLPVSEANERGVVEEIEAACTKALGEMDAIEKDAGINTSGDADTDAEDDTSPEGLCAVVRQAERKALTRTSEYMQREREALDLKVYYQERRLKDLGLDSEWDPESDLGGFDDDGLNYGQTRLPGGGDLDW